MPTYEEIKEMAARNGGRVTDYIALAPANDPFYQGKPADHTMGWWFAQLWQRFGYSSGVHLRRVHYQIISQQTPVVMPNGKPYENTEECWNFITQAGKVARYLGLVDPSAFVDRRNPEPTIHAEMYAAQPEITVYDHLWSALELPDFPDLPSFDLQYYQGRQRYHLEIWAEKSTMNDVLLPFCRQFNINLVTGLGELSITSCLQVKDRIVQGGRPARIFYVSDFDPAGASMPVAVSRKIEYFVRQAEEVGEELPDIRVYPVVLTLEQIRRYRLPRTPIKESEKRREGFERRHGSGAVELDALQALHPGELVRILREYVREYFDPQLWQRVAQARQELSEELERRRDKATEPYSEEIETLRQQYEAIRDEFAERLGGVQERVTEIWRAIAEELEQDKPDLNDYPIPEADESEADYRLDPLYDSQRTYGAQLHRYKEHQGKAAGDVDE